MNGWRFLTTTTSRKLFLLSLGALIIIVGVAWMSGYNQWIIHQAHKAKINVLKNAIAEAQRLAVTVAQTAATRTQMQQFVDVHEATMVDRGQFVWVIREISHLAESQPVGDVTTQPGSVVQHARKPAYQWYVTHLEFVGDYDQIGMFVRELENHFPEAEIRSLNIAATEVPAIHRAALDLALLVRPATAQKTEPKS